MGKCLSEWVIALAAGEMANSRRGGGMREPWWWQLENASVTGLPRSIMCGQFPQTTQNNALNNDDYFAKHFPPTAMHVLDIFP